MPGILQAHPRFILAVFAIFVVTLYLLVPAHHEPSIVPLQLKDNDLPSRLERAHRIYEKTLKNRKEFIQRYGPTPKEVEMFPEDKKPWPPYTVWDFFPASFNCPHEVERLGAMGDGGKWVCGLSRVVDKPDCVVYSFGIGWDSSYEADILHNTRQCEVWGYDSVVKRFGHEITSDVKHRTHFSRYSLGSEDRDDINRRWAKLETLMKVNGHDFIDILQVDLEGDEFDTLLKLIKPYVESGTPLPFGQLQLEVHIWDKSFEEILNWWELLEAAGLRPFQTEPNLVYLNYNRHATSDVTKYSFLNTLGNNIFIKDPLPTRSHVDAAHV